MLKDRNHGLCVTGPLDGQYLANFSNRYSVHIYETLGHVNDKATPLDETTFKVFDYYHVIGLRGTVEINFWVPFGKDSSWALDTIFQRYVDSKSSIPVSHAP